MHWFDSLVDNVWSNESLVAEDIIKFLEIENEVHIVHTKKILVDRNEFDVEQETTFIVEQIVLKVNEEYLIIESDLGYLIGYQFKPIEEIQVNGIYQARSKRVRQTIFVAVED